MVAMVPESKKTEQDDRQQTYLPLIPYRNTQRSPRNELATTGGFNSAAPPLRTATTVNHLLRDKVTQSAELMMLLEQHLKNVRSRLGYTTQCTDDLQNLLDKKLRPALALAQTRISVRQTLPNLEINADHPIDPEQTPHAHVQLAIFVSKHDAGGPELEQCLQTECNSLSSNAERIESFITFSNQMCDQVRQVEQHLQNYAIYSNYKFKSDHDCLRMERQQKNRNIHHMETTPPPVRLEDLPPMHEVMDVAETMLEEMQTFIRQARICLAEEKTNMKNLAMNTKLALRATLREGMNLKREMKEACLLLRNQIPIIGAQESEIKQKLAAQLKPLEICQQRYRHRIQSEGANELDDVQEVLKQELNTLGQAVHVMQMELMDAQQRSQATVEKEQLLNKYLKVQEAHIKLTTKLINMAPPSSTSNALIVAS